MSSVPPSGRFGRRVVATGIDAVLGFALAMFLATTPVGVFFARRAFVMFRIDQPGSVWKGPIPMVLGIFGEIVYTVPFAILIVAATETLIHRSPGKWILGLRIASADGNAGAGLEQRSLRVAGKMVGPGGFVLGLLTGSWLVALCSVVAGCVVITSVLVHRPLHDRVSRTRIVMARRPPRPGPVLPQQGKKNF